MTDTIFDLFPPAACDPVRPRAEARAGLAAAGDHRHGLSRRRKDHVGAALSEGARRPRHRLIVSEFGSEGIDDALLREGSDEVTLLGNGCLCCNTRSDLQIALRKLVADRDRRKIPHFDRVLIETSGLADISPILQTFSTDRALGGEFAIEVVLTVVDAVSGLKNLDRAPEARKQAILADRIVISKSDLSDIKTVKTLTARLHRAQSARRHRRRGAG